METDESIRLVSQLKSKANNFVMKELEKYGIKDIVPSHAAIIYNLSIYKELTLKDIAEKINRDKSTVTGLIAKLLKRGYIVSRRGDKDGRYSFISLSKKGSKLPPIFKKVSELLYKTEYKGVSREKQKDFLELLNLILKNLE